MNQFTTLTSALIPLPHANVDTDQIIPARYLKGVDKEGLASGLFADWRYGEDGQPRPDFSLNFPHCRAAQILLAGENFGCGSSREHAAWALTGWGVRVVIAPSFADIFRNNALKNGLLPVELSREQVQELFELVEKAPIAQLTVDLTQERVTLPTGQQFPFSIDPFARRCLIQGVDQMGYLLSHRDSIDAYEAQQGDLSLGFS